MALITTSSFVALQVISAAAAVYFFLSNYYSYKRLSKFSGPFLAQFTNIWFAWPVYQENQHEVTHKLIKQHGPFVRIGPNLLITDQVDLYIKVNAPKSLYRRSKVYNSLQFDPRIHNIISTLDETIHSNLRSKVGIGYSGKDVQGMEQSLDARIQDFVDLIRTKYISTSTVYNPIDFANTVSFLTLDVLTDVAFGAPFGYIKTDSDVNDYIKTITRLMPVVSMCQVFGWLDDLMKTKLVQALLAPTAEDMIGMGKMTQVARQVVATRYGDDRIDRKDMMGSFVRHGLTQLEAESESLLQIIAGSDTTSTAIRMTWLNIISNPRVYQKLRDEIIDGISTEKISSPFITDTEARQLTYLQACIKEGLRIFPPVAALQAKVVPPEGESYAGFHLPGGTILGFSAWAIQQSKTTYGQDAEYFRPERWLEAEGETLKRMNLVGELIFSHGRFKCLGYPLAMMELNKTFVQLMRNFEFSVTQPAVPFESRCNQIFIQRNMWMRVTERT